MKTFRSLALGALGAAVLGLPALAADVTIRLSHLNPESPFQSNSGAMTAVFKTLVESASGGEIEVKLFPNAQLGRDDEVIEQVRQGVIDSCISSSGGVASVYPMVGVFDYPFAFPDIHVASEVISDKSEFGRTFVADLEAKTGLHVLGMLDSGGFFDFTNSQRPIETLEDMKGLKIRTMTVPTHQAIIQSLGASATAMPGEEAYTALQTGVVDGQMNPIPVIGYMNLDEVQTYLTISNHIITPYVWFMNQDKLDSMTPEQRDIVLWAAEVATEAGRSISRIIEASDQGLPMLSEKLEVNTMSPEARAAFAEKTQPVVRQMIEETYGAEGIAMLDAMLSSIDAAQTSEVAAAE